MNLIWIVQLPNQLKGGKKLEGNPIRRLAAPRTILQSGLPFLDIFSNSAQNPTF